MHGHSYVQGGFRCGRRGSYSTSGWIYIQSAGARVVVQEEKCRVGGMTLLLRGGSGMDLSANLAAVLRIDSAAWLYGCVAAWLRGCVASASLDCATPGAQVKKEYGITYHTYVHARGWKAAAWAFLFLRMNCITVLRTECGT